MNKQLQTLLDDSRQHLRNRQLKKALNTAQIALEFGKNEGADHRDLVRAHLLLANIYHINGRYQNEPSFFSKSINHINEAKALNELLNDRQLCLNIVQVYARVQVSLRDYNKAVSVLQECERDTAELMDMPSIVFFKTITCEAYIGKGELEKAVELGEETLDFLNKNASPVLLRLWVEAYYQLSQAYIKQKEYSKSLEMSQRLLETARSAGDIEKEVLALRNIAVVCGVKSNYKIGMQYFLEALDKCRSIGFRELLVQLEVNIGTIYAHLYNYPEAVKRYLMVLREFDDVLEDATKVVVFNNLGNIYLTTDHPELAIEHFENAHSLAQTYQFQDMLAHSLAQLCRTKLQLNRLQEAGEEAEWADEIFAQIGETNGYQIHLLNQAEIAFRQKALKKSIELTETAIQAAQRLKDDACEIRGLKHLAKAHKASGNFEKALEYQEKYGEIQEAFAREQRNRQFLDMEIRHAIREKQKEIEQLTMDNKYKALLLQKSDMISRQNEELLRANEDLKQFSYVASHDLKEPLRMIGSYAQLIERKVGQHLDEDAREYFQFITGGVHRMNSLLDGLLKYATVGNVQPDLERVDLNNALVISLNHLRPRIEEANAAIHHGHLPEIRGDRELLVQLFQNLISNALKFKKANQAPEISISSYETADESTVFVKDNGIGISRNDQQKIFEIFHRLHSRDTYEGTGIGLAICQKIAKQLNGRLWVESEEGEGATFYFSTPK